MQPNTFLVKFNFVCPHCKNANSKLKTVTFTPDFAANTGVAKCGQRRIATSGD